MNYYQFYISEWVLHTSHLTLEEEAVYRRVLDYYYDTESPIPEKTQSVIRRLRLGSHSDILALILEEFFTLIDGHWHNLRADDELAKYHLKAESARENGRKGGRPKKQGVKKQPLTEDKNPTKTHPVNLANPEETQGKANKKLVVSNKYLSKESKPKKLTDDFDFSSWPQPLPDIDLVNDWLAAKKKSERHDDAAGNRYRWQAIIFSDGQWLYRYRVLRKRRGGRLEII